DCLRLIACGLIRRLQFKYFFFTHNLFSQLYSEFLSVIYTNFSCKQPLKYEYISTSTYFVAKPLTLFQEQTFSIILSYIISGVNSAFIDTENFTPSDKLSIAVLAYM